MTNLSEDHDVLAAARLHTQAGRACIPLPPRRKTPNVPNWPGLRLKDPDLHQHFPPGNNLGLLLGDPSGGLVDVDADVREAALAASELLPSTGMVHGRPGNPASHHWYKASGRIKTRKYQFATGDTGETSMLIELRSTGCQTMIPPSVHPDGDRLEWAGEGGPAQVDPELLDRLVARVAACTLIVRHWPGPGSRDQAAMALCGMLLLGGWSEEEADGFVTLAARLGGDEEWQARAKARQTAQQIAEGAPVTGSPRLSELLRDGSRVVEHVRRWLRLGDAPASAVAPQGGGQGSVATRLVDLASDVELFHTPAGEAYATLPVGDHVETISVRAKAFQRWLSRRYYKEHRTAPTNQAVKDALAVLEGEALYERGTHDIHVRLAQHGGAIYLDLGTDDWGAVEISATGWRPVADVPVRFHRPSGFVPLPLPVEGGHVRELQAMINVKDETSWAMLLAWLVAALRPRGPYPVLALRGEQGSAKSTLARMLRELIDPSTVLLRSLPRDERDLMISARNAWVLAFDNLSGLSQTLSDAFCRLATGGGFSTRLLRTDADEMLFDAMRPILVNGIEDVATRPDLAERAIILTLPPIAATRRRPERELLAAFYTARPRLLGALLDGVSAALRGEDGVHLAELPRMADFAIWATAAESGLDLADGAFMEAYTGNRGEAMEAALATDVVAEAVRALMSDTTHWEGTATQLMDELRCRMPELTMKSSDWPRAPHVLAGRLKRAAPFLRAIGIEVTFGRGASTRTITIEQRG